MPKDMPFGVIVNAAGFFLPRGDTPVSLRGATEFRLFTGGSGRPKSLAAVRFQDSPSVLSVPPGRPGHLLVALLDREGHETNHIIRVLNVRAVRYVESKTVAFLPA